MNYNCKHTMKKTSDLTNEEWHKVWVANSQLREQVFDRACDNTDIIINDDYLPYFKGVKMNYRFGVFAPCYLIVDNSIDNMIEFTRATREASKSVGLLCEVTSKALQHQTLMSDAEEALKKLTDVDYNDAEYDKLYDDAKEKFNALVSEVEKVMASEYRWCEEDENVESFFCEFIQHELEEDDSYFVDENYILYKRIVECYK